MKRRDHGFRSFDFPTADGVRYLLEGIPKPLWKAFRAACKARQVSARHRLLTLITQDIPPVEPAPEAPQGDE